MDDELVTIAEFGSYLAVVAARDALRGEGIECFVPQLLGDTDTRRSHELYPGLFQAGLELQVGRPDVDRAVAALQRQDLLGDRKLDYGKHVWRQ